MICGCVLLAPFTWHINARSSPMATRTSIRFLSPFLQSHEQPDIACSACILPQNAQMRKQLAFAGNDSTSTENYNSTLHNLHTNLAIYCLYSRRFVQYFSIFGVFSGFLQNVFVFRKFHTVF